VQSLGVYFPLIELLAIRLVKLLAIPLGCPKTAIKWLVIGWEITPAKSLVITLAGIPPRLSLALKRVIPAQAGIQLIE
jgi:hypothetical protein